MITGFDQQTRLITQKDSVPLYDPSMKLVDKLLSGRHRSLVSCSMPLAHAVGAD